MNATYTGETTPTWIDQVLHTRLMKLVEEDAADSEVAQYQRFAYLLGPTLQKRYNEELAALKGKDSGPEPGFHLYLTDQHRLKKIGDLMVVSLKGDPE